MLEISNRPPKIKRNLLVIHGVNQMVSTGQTVSNSLKQNLETSSTTVQPIKLHEVINRMIATGAKFDVRLDEFLIIDERNILSEVDMTFLHTYKTDILVHLQQTLLMKNLLSQRKDLFEDFAVEIKERQALAMDRGADEMSAYNEAVVITTREWYSDLMEVNR